MHAFAHITGGGIPGNLARVLPATATPSCTAARGRSRASSREIQHAGDVADDEMEQVFNLGLGMLAVVAGADARPALDAVRSAGHEAWIVGEVVEGRGRVIIERAIRRRPPECAP